MQRGWKRLWWWFLGEEMGRGVGAGGDHQAVAGFCWVKQKTILFVIPVDYIGSQWNGRWLLIFCIVFPYDLAALDYPMDEGINQSECQKMIYRSNPSLLGTKAQFIVKMEDTIAFSFP